MPPHLIRQQQETSHSEQARRQQAVSEQDVARLVKALQRLQPAALAALTSTCEAGGTGTEDDAQTAFADTLRSLAA